MALLFPFMEGFDFFVFFFDATIAPHVLNIACNLLSISKVIKELNYNVTFFPTECVF